MGTDKPWRENLETRRPRWEVLEVVVNVLQSCSLQSHKIARGEGGSSRMLVYVHPQVRLQD